MIQFLLDLDWSFFFLINEGSRNPVFDWLMPVISAWKYFWLPLGLVLALALLRGTPRTRWALAVLVVVFALGDSVSTYALKPLFGRPRPYSTLTEAYVFKGQWLTPGQIKDHETLSFPSTHAVNATGVALVLIYFFRRWWPVPAALALLICYSRVYLGLHYPADVLAGMVVGLGCGALVLGVQAWLIRLFPRRLGPLAACGELSRAEEART